MFKIESSLLQDEIARIKGGADKASLAQGHIFINSSTAEQSVSMYFVSDDLKVQKTIEAKVTVDAQFAAVASEFALKVGALPKDVMVQVKLENKKAVLSWGRNSSIHLQLAPEISPAIEIPEEVVSVEWEPGTIGFLTRNFVPFSAAPSNNRIATFPAIQGVYFSKNDIGELKVEATNASKSIVGMFNFDWFEENFAIPAGTLLSLNAVISSTSPIELGLNEQRTLLVIKCANTIAISRILSGKFPDISQHFTDENNAKIVWRADRMELLETARRTKKLSAGALRDPIITLKKDGKQHYVVLQDILTEQVGAVVESEATENIILDANNLEAALTVLRSEEILMTFNGASLALTVQPGDEGSAEAIRVLVAQMKE